MHCAASLSESASLHGSNFEFVFGLDLHALLLATATSRFGRDCWRNLSSHVSTADRIRRRIRLGLAALASEREITLKIDLQLIHFGLRLEKSI